MENLNNKIKELSEAIEKTEVYKSYIQALQEFENDKDAKKLFDDFQKAQKQLAILEEGDFEDKETQKEKTMKLLEEVKKNQKINNWLQKQQELGKLTGQVASGLSNEIKFPVTLPRQCGGGCC